MDVCSSYGGGSVTRAAGAVAQKRMAFAVGLRCRSKSVVGQFRFSYRTDVRRLAVVNVPLVCLVDVRAAVAAKSVETSPACRTRSCRGSDVFTQQFTYRSTSVVAVAASGSPRPKMLIDSSVFSFLKQLTRISLFLCFPFYFPAQSTTYVVTIQNPTDN